MVYAYDAEHLLLLIEISISSSIVVFSPIGHEHGYELFLVIGLSLLGYQCHRGCLYQFGTL